MAYLLGIQNEIQAVWGIKVRSSYGPHAYFSDIFISGKNENIGKIYKRAITWTDFCYWRILNLKYLMLKRWNLSFLSFELIIIIFFSSMAALSEMVFGNPLRRMTKTWSDVYQHYEDFWKFRLANPGANYRHHLKRIGHQKRLRNFNNAQSREQEDYSQWANWFCLQQPNLV